MSSDNPNEAISPLIKQVVQIHNLGSKFLYPCPWKISVDTHGFIEVKLVKSGIRLIPWYIFGVIITVLCGCGTCAIVLADQLSGSKSNSWIEWKRYNSAITLALLVCASMEISIILFLACNQDVWKAFPYIQKLELGITL